MGRLGEKLSSDQQWTLYYTRCSLTDAEEHACTLQGCS